MRNFFIALLLLLGTGVYADGPAYTPEKAFQRLKEGNQRFMTGRQDCIKNYLKELEQSKDKQEPYAAILCCSDSRIPPELIFDESLGKIFIIRVAGNVATDVTIGSIEYAVAQLKVPIVVVLGHEACGVLVAALKGAKNLPPFVRDLVKETSFAVEDAEKESSNFDTQLHTAIIKNVEFQMQELIEKSVVLKEAVKKKQTMFQGAVFYFDDGRVDWCPCK
jgi:carbonic anhydrase